MTLGESIKNKRKKMNMTQKQLAAGICTQGQISKIEKNEIVPLSNLLKNIADRLNVTIDELYNNKVKSYDLDKKEYELYLQSYDFELLEKKLSEINMNALNYNDKTYVRYLKLVVRYEVYNEDMTKELKNLIDSNTGIISDELIARILNSISIIFIDKNEFDQAEYYIERAYTIVFLNKLDEKISVKILNNYLRFLNGNDKYRDLYDKSTETINFAFQNNIYNYISEAIYFKYLALENLKLLNLKDEEEIIFAKYISKKQRKLEITKKLNRFNKYF